MKYVVASLILALADSATAGDGKTECKCKPREVGDSGSKVDWPLYTKGVKWHRSLDEARAMAGEAGKLVLYYHVVGDLDKEGC